MKKYYLLIMMLFTFNLFSQTSGWMPVTRITNSKTQDRNPSMPERDMNPRSGVEASELVFDRTDSTGTNICVIKCISGKWSTNIQCITTGEGLKEYPAIGDSIIVFQNRTDRYSNLYCSHFFNNSWSEPEQLTFDTNKYNLYPKVYTFFDERPPVKLITWEKDKKIFYNSYYLSKWNKEIQISPNDTFEYSNPVISYDGYIAIAFERKINEKNIQILLAHTDGEFVTIDTVWTKGINKNPKFLNGRGNNISWENNTTGNWQILGRKTGTFGASHYYYTFLSDTFYNFNQFTGLFMDMPIPHLENNFFKNNIHLNDLLMAVNCIYIRTDADSPTLMLDGRYSKSNTNHRDGKNGAISRFRAVGGNRTWAVWETEEDGYTNLYGSYENLFPTKAEEYIKPFEFILNQNYPNPFNPSTVISYSVGAQGLAPVQIKIYDILGREVKTLVDEYKPAGEYKVTFDAKGLSGGVYFYRLVTGAKMETKRMILVK